MQPQQQLASKCGHFCSFLASAASLESQKKLNAKSRAAKYFSGVKFLLTEEQAAVWCP